MFVGSYLCTRADALRKVQMVGAALWIGYGVVMQAAPVITANVLVLGAAAGRPGARARLTLRSYGFAGYGLSAELRATGRE